jgi:hypothetical protein
MVDGPSPLPVRTGRGREKNSTRRANQSSRQKPVQPYQQKYFTFADGQISSTSSRRPTRQKGRIASRHERAVGCGGRDSVGRAKGIAGEPERALSDRPARGRTALQPAFARVLPDRTRPGERSAETVADGEVVWSWRPDAGVKPCGDASTQPGCEASSFGKATVANKPVTGESTK